MVYSVDLWKLLVEFYPNNENFFFLSFGDIRKLFNLIVHNF